MVPDDTNDLRAIKSVIDLTLQGLLRDAQVALNEMVASSGSPLAGLKKSLSLLLEDLVTSFSSKESALASVQISIMEMEAAQEELSNREARFRTTLISIGDGLISTDAEGRVDFMNPAAEQLTGWNMQDAVGRPITDVFDIFNAITGDAVENPTERSLREGVVVDLANHTVLIARDGTERQIADSCAPIRDEKGLIIGSVLVFRDVTEEYRRREQLRESEERYRVLFHNSRDAMMTLAPPSWRFSSGNPAALAMFGATAEIEFTSLGPMEVSPEFQPDGGASSERAQERIGEALRTGSAFFPWTHRKLDGNVFHTTVLLTKSDLNGETIVQATVRDVTQQQRLEAELHQARKLEAVGQLAAGIAHEINTPAQFVSDSLHFLGDSCRSVHGLLERYREILAPLFSRPGFEPFLKRLRDAEEEADLEYVAENTPAAFARALDGVGRISSIVSAMKEFAHPDQREKSPADLNRALQATLTIARNEYKYVADVETDFGELPSVLCHAGDLNQVFLNLFINAAHAIAGVVGDSGDRGCIHVRTRCDDGRVVRIDIRDTGCGIPDGVRARIFEPFFTTKEVGRGSGQGLAIARNIVESKHRGSLTFRSECGRGTTFTVQLPVDGDSPVVAAWLQGPPS
ncbi:MAG: PAS domain S-box protein [Deltaproteobacteria bacterium]|nr:PAS domain S-box protein [Deltaproteobacteria bacterium]